METNANVETPQAISGIVRSGTRQVVDADCGQKATMTRLTRSLSVA
jgi:hypothetical protein